MDALLSRMTQQAMNYAIRSGVTIATSYTIKQCGRLLQEAPKGKEREEIAQLQLRLHSKIRIISPAIDMIELISARGNTSLESVLVLTKEIRFGIQQLGVKLSRAVEDEKLLHRNSSAAKSRKQATEELNRIIADIKRLLLKIEDSVPLINLAITTSGINLSTKLSATVSPSRLLQASTFLSSADFKYNADPEGRTQVGPTFVVSLYMLFRGHAWRPVDETGIRDNTWKEVIHKARMKLIRVPLDQVYDLPGEQREATAGETFRESTRVAEFAYQLLIIEDLDDDRVHTFDSGNAVSGRFDEVLDAGLRDVVPIHQISKIFYADTGKILNIGGDSETNNPVLLIKRDTQAEPPRRMMQRSLSLDLQVDDLGYSSPVALNESVNSSRPANASTPKRSWQDPWPAVSPTLIGRLPQNLDPEWMAFEVYAEDTEADDESDGDFRPERSSARHSVEPSIHAALSRLSLGSMSPSPKSSNDVHPLNRGHLQTCQNNTAQLTVKTSLSLLEMLLKLAALQQFRQESHLAVEDEMLNFFLEDSSTAGSGPSKEHRQRTRHDAIKRVGFDPYDESPIKRHSGTRLDHAANRNSPRSDLLLGPQKRWPNEFDDELEDAVSGSSPGSGTVVMPSVEKAIDVKPVLPLLPSAILYQTPSRSSTPGASLPITPSGDEGLKLTTQFPSTA